MKGKFLKTLTVLCMVSVLVLIATGCGGSGYDMNDDGLEEIPDVVEGGEYQEIDPYNDGPITMIDTEQVSVKDVEPGTILGKFDAGDYQITLSKPQLPESYMKDVNEYDYQWLMVNQIGGGVEEDWPVEDGGYSLIIFFPENIKVTAYSEPDEGYASGEDANFGYEPDVLQEGGQYITTKRVYGYSVSPTDVNDELIGLSGFDPTKMELYRENY